MRNRLMLSVVLGSVILLGCTKSAEGQKPTPSMIADSLLTITDMEGDWKETQREAFDPREPENPSIDPSLWCPEAIKVTKDLVDLAGETGSDVEMEFEGLDDGARMMRLQAWSNDDVDAYFANASEAVRICDGKTNTDEGGATSTFAIVENRDIGDESISWVQITRPPEGTGQDKFETVGRTTIARFGGIIMVLQIGDFAPVGTGELMDEDSWWEIVEKASEKLDRLNSQVHD